MLTIHDLIVLTSQNSGIPQTKLHDALTAFTDTIIEQVTSGEEVSLPRLGKFKLSVHGAKTSRNPKTGETVECEPCTHVKFSVSSTLKDAVKRRVSVDSVEG